MSSDTSETSFHESSATQAPQATQSFATPSNDATATSTPSAASVADAAPVAALANDLAFTLTVGQARALFAEHGRKVPAERTLQHYCIEGTIAAQKIRTTYGAEWLINDASLLAHIDNQPIVTTATEATPAALTHAAPRSEATASPAMSDASDAVRSDLAAPIGERRTLADVLIENAKLLATIEGRDHVIRGKDETITELKDDRSFLRDEVREARQQRKDVKDIASRMLEAMQTIAVAGKLPPAKRPGDNITARIIEPDEPHSES